jgi:hypothetical protein
MGALAKPTAGHLTHGAFPKPSKKKKRKMMDKFKLKIREALELVDEAANPTSVARRQFKERVKAALSKAGFKPEVRREGDTYVIRLMLDDPNKGMKLINTLHKFTGPRGTEQGTRKGTVLAAGPGKDIFLLQKVARPSGPTLWTIRIVKEV